MDIERNRCRLYDDLSWIWPLISPVQEYREETDLVSALIRENSLIEPHTLLHLGCGGGHNDFTFKKYFSVTGIDLSPHMLNLARTLNPEVEYFQDDMRTVQLESVFDAVVILDSITYMKTPEELYQAFHTAYEHLREGGIFITFAEELKDLFVQNTTHITERVREPFEIIFIENMYDPDPEDTTFECTFLYLIRENGKLSIESDHHLLGIFPHAIWMKTLEEVGFSIEEKKLHLSTFPEEFSLPLFICTKC
ncbi:MAG: class I SAM-dependent methyltransferase [Theionarchaea archaeon]|nr:class I SAM-dependent methyltransferase [Theionarchaea archaeon]